MWVRTVVPAGVRDLGGLILTDGGWAKIVWAKIIQHNVWF